MLLNYVLLAMVIVTNEFLDLRTVSGSLELVDLVLFPLVLLLKLFLLASNLLFLR